ASFDDQVDDLLAVLDGRRAVLAGHSFGGLVCLAAAERHPELVAAVLAYEAPMPWEPWWPSQGAGSRALADAGGADPAVPVDAERAGDAAERFLRRMIGDAAWERLPAAVRAERRAEGPTLVAELRSVRPPAPRPYDPARVAVPVVAAHGSRTADHHVRAAEALARAAPRAELAIIEGAGHGAHLTHPEAFAGLVQRAMELAREGAGEGGERGDPAAVVPPAPTGPGGVRAVGGRQPGGAADRHAPRAGGARHRAGHGARLLGRGDQRRRAGPGPDPGGHRPARAPVAGARRRRPHAP